MQVISNYPGFSYQLASSGGTQEGGFIRVQPCTEYLRAVYAMPVTDDGIYELCSLIDHSLDYYQFRSVELQIHSLGGSGAALKHFLLRREHWLRSGVELRTQALNQSCSAAAFMLSLGTLGQRSAQPHSLLVYHFCRVASEQVLGRIHQQSEGQLTALKSRKAVDQLLSLQEMMSREDETLLDYLILHLVGTSGSRQMAWACAEITQRISHVQQWMNHQPEPRRNSATSLELVTTRKLIDRLKRASNEASLIHALKKEIGRIFADDAPVSPATAYLLLLIDQSGDLKPSVKPQMQ